MGTAVKLLLLLLRHYCPADIYLFKVNNRNNRTSKLKHISHLGLMFEHVLPGWVATIS